MCVLCKYIGGWVWVCKRETKEGAVQTSVNDDLILHHGAAMLRVLPLLLGMVKQEGLSSTLPRAKEPGHRYHRDGNDKNEGPKHDSTERDAGFAKIFGERCCVS